MDCIFIFWEKYNFVVVLRPLEIQCEVIEKIPFFSSKSQSLRLMRGKSLYFELPKPELKIQDMTREILAREIKSAKI